MILQSWFQICLPCYNGAGWWDFLVATVLDLTNQFRFWNPTSIRKWRNSSTESSWYKGICHNLMQASFKLTSFRPGFKFAVWFKFRHRSLIQYSCFMRRFRYLRVPSTPSTFPSSSLPSRARCSLPYTVSAHIYVFPSFYLQIFCIY